MEGVFGDRDAITAREAAELLQAAGVKATEFDVADHLARIGAEEVSREAFAVLVARDYADSRQALRHRRESLLGTSGLAELERAFRELDRDGDGRLGERDLAEALGVCEAEARQMVREVGSGGGFISMAEFVQALSP